MHITHTTTLQINEIQSHQTTSSAPDHTPKHDSTRARLMRHRFCRPQQAPEEGRELARRVVCPVTRGSVLCATVAAQSIRTSQDHGCNKNSRQGTSKYVRETCEAVLRTSGKLRRQPEEPCAAAPARTGAPRPRSLPVAPAASIIEMEG